MISIFMFEGRMLPSVRKCCQDGPINGWPKWLVLSGFILTQFRHSYTLRNEPLAEKRHRYNLAGEQQLPVLK